MASFLSGLLILSASLAAWAGDGAGAAEQPALNLVEQAAAALAVGREGDAAELLARHVDAFPDELLVRAQLAELLYRQGSYVKARRQFALFLAAAQGQRDIAFRYIIHGHSRLVDISEKLDLPYEEHLNRGIGLYLLAKRRAQEPELNGEFSATMLFTRAAQELQKARALDSQQARVHLYLFRVWTELGQVGAAQAALAEADRHALYGVLSPYERRDLTESWLAWRRFLLQPSR
jgi:thioredoxin-like negative regulator of GroEL